MTSFDVRPLEPVANLRVQVENVLAAAIISGEMPAGELFSAPGLAARFEVSATPVREAMLNLEKRGFVETVRNKGYRVTTVSDQDLRDVVDVRLLLEPAAMRALAGRIPLEHEAELRGKADRIVKGARSGDLIAYLEADSEFHLQLTGLLGNNRLTQVIAELRSQTRLVGLVNLLDSEELMTSAREHGEILDHLKAGNGDEVDALMHRHISHVLGWWAGRPETP